MFTTCGVTPVRSTPVALLLLAVMPSWIAAQEAKETTFWLAPKATLDLNSLTPAAVQLIAGPDPTRKFALLQVGETVPVADYIQPGSTPNEDAGYRVIPGGLKAGVRPYGDRTYKIEKLPD